jgi:hypothetical protein
MQKDYTSHTKASASAARSSRAASRSVAREPNAEMNMSAVSFGHAIPAAMSGAAGHLSALAEENNNANNENNENNENNTGLNKLLVQLRLV